MIAAYRKIISSILLINPKATILMAQVVESGKLPKYSYIPKLNKEIAKMVKALRNDHVVLVDQSKGFHWSTMTIQDKVHPNRLGREQMAKVWFAALSRLLVKPPHAYQVERVVYKILPSGDSLYAHVFDLKGSCSIRLWLGSLRVVGSMALLYSSTKSLLIWQVRACWRYLLIIVYLIYMVLHGKMLWKMPRML